MDGTHENRAQEYPENRREPGLRREIGHHVDPKEEGAREHVAHCPDQPRYWLQSEPSKEQPCEEARDDEVQDGMDLYRPLGF